MDNSQNIVKKKVIIKNKTGLHARPAALFVQVANKFDSEVTVKKGNEKINGKSIMGILMLAACQGQEVLIIAEGPDAQKAVEALEKILLTDESK